MSTEQPALEISKPDLKIDSKSPDRFSRDENASPGMPNPKTNSAFADTCLKEVMQQKQDIDDTVAGLDEKLNLVLAKQEYEYLKSYNIYVKRKEYELRELITKLNDKNSNNTLKDEKINNLEKTIQSIRDDQIRMEKEKDDQAKKIKKWQSRSNNFEQERDFLHAQVLESKRQNKLLKLAIGRLQTQIASTPGTKSDDIPRIGDINKPEDG